MTRALSFVAPKQPQPLGQVLDVQARRDPRRAALTCGPTTLTRAELAFRARARAHALDKAGVQEGDLVALVLPNGPAILELAFGCWALGATPVPLSHRLPPLELRALLQVLRPRLTVGDTTIEGLSSLTSRHCSTGTEPTRRCQRESRRTSRRSQAAAAPDSPRSSWTIPARYSIPIHPRSACTRQTP